jgi:hypothetical protein
MKEVILKKSSKDDKRYMVEIDGKTIHFGSKLDNFTIHKDVLRRKYYIDRHKKNEDWNDILTAGFWSRWLLWEKPTIESAKKNIEKKYNVKFV